MVTFAVGNRRREWDMQVVFWEWQCRDGLRVESSRPETGEGLGAVVTVRALTRLI